MSIAPYKYRNIALEGNIGAGKTSLAKVLGTQLDARLILESFENNPFLDIFYGDPKRYAFQVELFFLAERYHQLTQGLLGDIFVEHSVFDYVFVKSRIFAGINLQGAEFELFMSLFSIMDRFMPRPDILVYLHIPVEGALKNIAQRGRSYEQEIPAVYLSQVEAAYFNYLKEEKRFPIVVLDESREPSRDIVGTMEKIDHILSSDWNDGISYFSE